MRLLLLVASFLCFGFTNKPVSAVVLKNGKEVKTYSEPALEKNMLAIVDKKGRKILVSKTLIDWAATRETSIAFYQLAYPEKAKAWLAKPKPKSQALEKPRRKIVINNDTLKTMSADQGLASEWKGQPVETSSGSRIEKTTRSSGPSIKTIRGGGKLNLKQHLETDKLVIFDFYADWCGPCRRLTPQLEKLVRKHPDQFALRKVDIIKWGTPVAQQFNIRGIPYVEVYTDKGRQKFKGNGFSVLKRLQKEAK